MAWPGWLEKGRAVPSVYSGSTERGRLRGQAAGLLGAAVDLLLPPRCFGCGVIVAGDGLLCGPCWTGLAFITAPLCGACGFPFDHAGAEAGEGLCAACLARPPAYTAARAAVRYDDGVRAMLLGFKHGDRTEAPATLARWMAVAGRDLLGAADGLVPVPLHRRRLLARRFNQAALLSAELARQTGLAHWPRALRRPRATASQGGLSRKGRFRNVRGAFAVGPGWAKRLAGKHVVLVDDVLTTGATAEACARLLRRSGAGRVDVLTVARVVQPAAHSL